MTELWPYVGVTVVIFAVMITLKVLARQGIRLKRLKYDKTELEFEASSTSPEAVNKLDSAQTPVLMESQIELSSLAQADCQTLGIDSNDAIKFILGEATRHPLLFEAKFNSLPLVFAQNVLLLSWDCSKAGIERILNREQAYPLNDNWSCCLSVYRKATLLPYRTKEPNRLYTSTEARRSLAIFRKLISLVNEFIRTLRDQGHEPPKTTQDLGALIDEAELALANDDVGTSVARMEVVLSTVHKFLLHCAPQGKSIAHYEPKPAIEVPQTSKPSVLLVDDLEISLEGLKHLLNKSKYDFTIVMAQTTQQALRAIVEHDFDLVITDLVMNRGIDGPEMDGREVAIAAKKSSSKTKVIVYSAYAKMARTADFFKLVDVVLSKGQTSPSELIDMIQKLIEDSRKRREVSQ